MSPKRKSAGKKATQTRKRRAAARKAAATRKHRAAGKKAVKTRVRKAGAKKATLTRAKRKGQAQPAAPPAIARPAGITTAVSAASTSVSPDATQEAVGLPPQE